MRSLAIGESLNALPVDSSKRRNGTGISVRPGQRYVVSASDETWSDAGIVSTASGQRGSGLQSVFSRFKRCQSAQWFELVAYVENDDQLAAIGLLGTLTVAAGAGGELGFFANDASFMYWNNHGTIHVSVTREA